MGESDSAFFQRLRAARRAERAAALEEAKRRDHAEGKEPFDLERFLATYSRQSWWDHTPDRADLLEEYEMQYYVRYPHLGRIGELVAYLEILDAGDSPTGGNGAVALADRASELAYRDDASSLTDAAACYERLLSWIPEGADAIPLAKLDSVHAARWMALAPHRFRRADIRAALDRVRARIEGT